MRALIGVALALACTAAGTARAQPSDAAEDPLEEGLELFERLRLDAAGEALERALEVEDRTLDELADIYLRLGIVAAADGDAGTAERYFTQLLAVDPEARLPPGMSPFVKEAFAKARARWGDARLHIEELHPPALDEDEVALRLVGREDRASMVLALSLSWKPVDATGWKTETTLGLGPHRFELPGLEPGDEVVYHAALLGDRRAVLTRLGSPAAPRRATVQQEVSGPLAWYERWYTWLGAGVVVTAVTVGLLFGLRPDAQTYDARVVLEE